jgi:hypothetical protein
MVIHKRKLNDFRSEFTRAAVGLPHRPYADKENACKAKTPAACSGQSTVDPYRIKQARRRVTYLGVVNMDPNDYVQRYGKDLVDPANLPDFVKSIPTPPDLELVGVLDSVERGLVGLFLCLVFCIVGGQPEPI